MGTELMVIICGFKKKKKLHSIIHHVVLVSEIN